MKKKLFFALVIAAIVIGTLRIHCFASTGIYDSLNVSEELLENRNGKLIIERVVGYVIDWDGNGIVLNARDRNYDYISYAGIRGARPGDLVVTYLYYNTETNYVDDVIYRSDWTIGNLYDIDQQEVDINLWIITGNPK